MTERKVLGSHSGTASEYIDIAPIDWWVEDGEMWWHEWKPGLKCCFYCDSKRNVVEHKLCELGHRTNKYRYAVYINGHPILIEVFGVGCCMERMKCPIGKLPLPNRPCRDYVRKEAIKQAHKLWIQLVKELIK